MGHRALFSKRSRRAFALIPAVLIFAATCLSAQTQPSSQTQVLDSSALHPPPGARVAMVEFDDLECPACAHANPSLMAAAKQYNIPWIRHDFLIPYHQWSRIGAINARWLDEQRKGLGDEYRNAVFASQSSIYNLSVLDKFTQDFARSHGLALPFNVDPQGKLAAEVEADNQLGKRTGIRLTPTIFIVMAHHNPSFMQVLNVDTDLYHDIDQAMDETKGEAAAPAHGKSTR